MTDHELKPFDGKKVRLTRIDGEIWRGVFHRAVDAIGIRYSLETVGSGMPIKSVIEWAMIEAIELNDED